MGQVKRDSIINTAIMYGGIGIGYLNKGLLFPLLLLTEEVGLINVVLLVVSFFGQLSNLGTGMLVMRFLPFMRGKEAGYSGLLFFTTSILLGGIGLVSIILLIFNEQILSFFVERSPMLLDYSIWIIPLGIASAFFSLFEHYLRAISKNIVSVFIQDFILRISVLVCLVIFYFGLVDIQTFLVLFFSLHFIPVFFLFLYLIYLKQLYVSASYLSIGKKLRKHMIGYGLIVYVNSIGRNIILMADTIMLSVLSGLKEVGVFTTMVFLSNALFVPYVSVIKTAAPNVPRLWKKRDMEGLTELYKKVSSIGYFVTFTLFSLVWFNIDLALSYLPKDYSGGKYIFLLLMVGRMFDALGGINGDILLTSKKFKIEIWLTVPLIMIVFLFNYFLIPIYGGLGAAIVTAGVYILYNVLRVFFNLYFFNLFPYDRQFLKLFGISIVMFGIGSLADYFLVGILHFLIVTIIPMVFFVLPVYRLNLIPEINGFIHQVLIKLKLKNAN